MIQRFSPQTFVLCLAFMAVGVTPALGQLVEEEQVGRLTIGGGIGVLIPSMSEVNRNIDVVNPFLNNDEIRSIDKINSALLTGLDIRYRLGRSPKEDPDEPISFLDRISLGFTWGAINASTGLDDVERARVRLFSRATTYFPYVLYHLPFTEKAAPRTQLMIGGGPILLASGYMEWEVEDKTNNIFIEEGDISELAGVSKATGTGAGFAFLASSSMMLNARFSAAVDVGYRVAKISDLSLDEAVGQAKRFPGDDDPDTEDVVRRLGDWTVIDFFLRDKDGEWNGRKRTDPGPLPNREEDKARGGCSTCPGPYYTGGGLDIDYSGMFVNLTLRVHF